VIFQAQSPPFSVLIGPLIQHKRSAGAVKRWRIEISHRPVAVVLEPSFTGKFYQLFLTGSPVVGSRISWRFSG
jgi:hypothetical protein